MVGTSKSNRKGGSQGRDWPGFRFKTPTAGKSKDHGPAGGGERERDSKEVNKALTDNEVVAEGNISDARI